jgi:hypothetical protein|tara:strand:- start:14666 stop:15028 length:363 start_codon:yes stop_codon:yes gene_type:complete
MQVRVLRRRIAENAGEPVCMDANGATRKLVELVERAQANGREQGPLVPVEALVTIEGDDWIWQIVDHDVLEMLSHRLVFQNQVGIRREILMTAGLETAVSAASRIVELDGGCVLIETLEP